MIEQLLAWKSVVIGLWLALFFILERYKPASPWKPENASCGFSQTEHLLQNISLWLVNLLVSPLLLLGFTIHATENGLLWRQQWLPGDYLQYGLIFDILILDLWIYLWHRMNHQIPLLWRFHQVHHLDQQLDSTSALRFHFGEVVLSAIVRMPVILVFAIPLTSVVIFEALVTVAAVFHHANARLPKAIESKMALVIITPSLHWVHHHALRKDTDSNYGTVLSCWDRWFLTLSGSQRSDDMVLGVENRVENRISRLFLLPFGKQRRQLS